MIRQVAVVMCAAGLLALGAAGCASSTGSGNSAATARVGTCLSGASGNSAATPSSVASAPGARGVRLPSQTLDCFDGSGAVRLTGLAKPAVISLWASWCAPCQRELPNVEAFARSAGPALVVIGVDTADDRSRAQSTIHDLSLTYPMISDPDQAVLHAASGVGLPTTLFVAPGGAIRYVYQSSTVLDLTRLATLAKRYLGVSVNG